MRDPGTRGVYLLLGGVILLPYALLAVMFAAAQPFVSVTRRPSSSGNIALNSGWDERSFQATAPAGVKPGRGRAATQGRAEACPH